MPSRTLPGLGLQGFWDSEEDGWDGDPGMDGNLRSLSVLAQLSVKDQDLTVAPASPSQGDTYIVAPSATGTWVGQDAKIAVYDAGSWVYLPPKTGMIAYVEDEEVFYRYDAGWFPLVKAYAFSTYCNYRQIIGAVTTWEIVPVNNARHNDQGIWSAGTGLFTAPVTGFYHFHGFWTYSEDTITPGFVAAGFSINGATPAADHQRRYTGALVTEETSVAAEGTLKLTAGDTVGMVGFISSGNGSMAANKNAFAGFKIG